MLAASPMRAASPSAPAPDPVERSAAQPSALTIRADPRTGRLVRTNVMRANMDRARTTQPSLEIGKLVEQSARAHDVDPLLVQSIIHAESNYNPNAVSPKGAQGLMQLTPSTARMLGVGDSFDPGQNIEGGVKYLKYLQSVYKDDRLALAAYNAGPGAVDKYKSIPPYPETQNYVHQVGKYYDAAQRAAGATAVVAAVPEITDLVPAESTEENHPKLEQFVDQDGRLHLRTVQ